VSFDTIPVLYRATVIAGVDYSGGKGSWREEDDEVAVGVISSCRSLTGYLPAT